MHTTLHNEVGTIQALIASVSAGGLYKDTKGKKKKKRCAELMPNLCSSWYGQDLHSHVDFL